MSGAGPASCVFADESEEVYRGVRSPYWIVTERMSRVAGCLQCRDKESKKYVDIGRWLMLGTIVMKFKPRRLQKQEPRCDHVIPRSPHIHCSRLLFRLNGEEGLHLGVCSGNARGKYKAGARRWFDRRFSRAFGHSLSLAACKKNIGHRASAYINNHIDTAQNGVTSVCFTCQSLSEQIKCGRKSRC
jgi:hypothetical protein